MALHLIVLTLSGTLLLFRSELGGENGDDRETSAEGTSPDYAAALSSALGEYPKDRPLAIYPDDEDPSVLRVRLGQDGAREFRGARKLDFDALTGARLGERGSAWRQGLFEWLLVLHRELFLGSWGKLYVGFVGVLLAFVLAAGVWIYGGFMRGRSYGELRAEGGSRAYAELHKFVGVTVVSWALVVALSGCFLAFNSALIRVFQARSLGYLVAKYPASGQAAAPRIPVERAVAEAERARPGTRVSFVAFPDTEYSLQHHYLVLVNGTTPLTSRMSELVAVDARSGAAAEVIELPWYLELVMLSEPMHFGDYGGFFLKSLWALYSLATLGLSVSGAWVFARKRRKSAKSAKGPSLESVPRASVKTWSGPVAARPYVLPALGGVAIAAGAVGSLLLEGWSDAVALAAMSAPAIAILWALAKLGLAARRANG